MKKITPGNLAPALSVCLALTAGIAPPLPAQNETVLEEVVVTGTRRQARSALDSAAPIDVIGGEDFRNQGGSDLVDLIRAVVPSYNVNTHPISDAATVVRPANLRGLAPDHTLVLLNSKRHHRSAVITWLSGGLSDGAQGPDIAAFPAIALKNVEVLRDGASSQYGSDAIAGVMNFILKDADDGASLETRYGQYTEGNEAIWSVAGNIGLPFTDNGFVNLSFEYGESDPTSRSVQRNDAQALIDAGNTAVANPAQIWGSPDIRDDLKTTWNLGLNLSADTEFYLFGNFAKKETEGGFYFRNPDTRNGVFDIGNDVTRLVGDLTPDGSGDCPVVQVGDEAALAAVIADPDCFVFNELFPGGFTPRFGAETEDFSTVVGLRGVRDSGLTWDLSGSFANNVADFFIFNTVNASLGPLTPTRFDPGDYRQIETNFNADFSYPLTIPAFASDLNVAFGFEWRREEFEIKVGDQASWEVGPLASQGFVAASNGFPGFGPLVGGDWDRANIAAYLDLEADLTDRWLLGLAVRWEDFDDFGTTANGKIATHFAVTDTLGLRATYSTGFRAPTPGQSNAFNISTQFDPALGDLTNNGTIPSTNPLAALRGGSSLDPEESENVTFGLVLQTGAVVLTVDYFNIEVKDRLAISQNYDLTPGEIEELLASGITAASAFQRFNFFTNEIDTTTRGFDVVGTWSRDWDAGATDLNLAYNRTRTNVDSGVTNNIDAQRIAELEKSLPETRFNVSLIHTWNNWRFLARYNYFDEWLDAEDLTVDETYDGYGTLDAEMAYSFGTGLTLVLGSANITDETPEENPRAAETTGNRYSQRAPGGFNGAFWYARAIYDF